MITPKFKKKKNYEKERAEREARKKWEQEENRRAEEEYEAIHAAKHFRENMHFFDELKVLTVAAKEKEIPVMVSVIGSWATFVFAIFIDLFASSGTHSMCVFFCWFLVIFITGPLYAASVSALNNPEPLPESIHKNCYKTKYKRFKSDIIDSLEYQSGEHIRTCDLGENADPPVTWESSIRGAKESISYRNWVIWISVLCGVTNIFVPFIFFL